MKWEQEGRPMSTDGAEGASAVELHGDTPRSDERIRAFMADVAGARRSKRPPGRRAIAG